MFLREFIYFDKKHQEMSDDLRYDSDKDTSILGPGDLRKMRLTLGMLNSLRKSGEAREKERIQELGLVRKMYAAPPPEAPAA